MNENGQNNITSEDKSNSESTTNRVLEMQYQSAKERLIQQRETFKLFSEDGRRYLRLLLVLIGTPIAIVGVISPSSITEVGNLVTSTDCAVGSNPCVEVRHVNWFVFFSILGSFTLNTIASGFEAVGTYNVLNPEDIDQNKHTNKSANEYLIDRISKYSDRIEHNDRVIHVLETMLSLGKVTFSFATFGFGLLLYTGITNQSLPIWIFFMALIIAFSVLFSFWFISPTEYKKSDNFLKFDPLYSRENINNTDSSHSGQEEELNKNSKNKD